MRKTYLQRLIFFIILFFLLTWIVRKCSEKGIEKEASNTYIEEQGKVFGTFYSIKYESNRSYKEEYTKALQALDASLSTFNDTSVITRFNKGERPIVADSLFVKVLNKGFEISQVSNGAFDMTVAPLVNACGFGFDPKRGTPDSIITEIKKHVGYDKVSINNLGEVVCDDKEVKLDASAIAKGFGVDIVANVLRKNGVVNFMVEIGGEVSAQGVNSYGEIWNIGICKPVEDSTMANMSLQCVTELNNKCLATSGNYLQYYYKDGKKYSHTIDPRSGGPVSHSLLSVSIKANDCMTADALATACMVVGTDSAMSMIEKLDGIEGYFIYDYNGEFRDTTTKGFLIKK